MTGIDSGRRVTLADVAARAGVDRSVVSRVVNGDPGLSIRETTRRRVDRAIRELGYRPNSLARGLRTMQAGALGLVIPDFENPIYAAVIKGAAAEAAKNEYLLVSASAAHQQASRDALELLTNGRVDGMLFAGSRADGSKWGRLEDLYLPWLMLNQRTAGGDRYVILDDAGAAALAVQHLVGLGHERIAHLAGQSMVDTAVRRREGYVRAMTDAGLEVKASSIVPALHSNEGGAEAVQLLLRRRVRPTAIVVSNIASAIGALHAIRLAGVRVPEEMSVIAVHDLPVAAYLHPPLTTVRLPLEALGHRGVDLLLHGPALAPISEVLPGVELVLRESTGPAPG